MHTSSRGARVCSGTIRGRDGSDLFIVVREGEIVGNVPIPTLDPRASQKCGANEPGIPSVPTASREHAAAVVKKVEPALLDASTQYDLMIVFTPAAIKDIGGLSAIEVLADLAVETPTRLRQQ